MADTDLQRVRGVEGTAWAFASSRGTYGPLGGGDSHGSTADFRNVIMLGLDDDTLIGAPREMVLGSLADLKKPDAVIIDEKPLSVLWPEQPLRIGMETGDERPSRRGRGHLPRRPPPSIARYCLQLYSRGHALRPAGAPDDVVRARQAPKTASRPPELCRRIHDRDRPEAFLRRVRLEHDSLSTVENTGNSRELRRHGAARLHRWGVAIAVSDVLPVHHRESQAVRGAQAMGTSNGRIIGMILTAGDSSVCSSTASAWAWRGLFEGTSGVPALKAFHMYWEVWRRPRRCC